MDHKVELHTLRRFFESRMGSNPYEESELTVPEQKLLAVTAGRVYHDGLGELEEIRTSPAYYPEDVWLCLLPSNHPGKIKKF